MSSKTQNIFYKPFEVFQNGWNKIPSFSTVSDYLLYTQPFGEIKRQWQIVKNHAFPIRSVLTSFVNNSTSGIKRLVNDYPAKQPDETRFAYSKRIARHAIQKGITTKYLRGCYDLGMIPGYILTIVGGNTAQAIGITLQIAKSLLNLTAFAVINMSAISLGATAFAVDSLIKGMLHFSNKKEAYNLYIDKKLTEKLPEKYAALAQTLRGFKTPEPEPEPSVFEKAKNLLPKWLINGIWNLSNALSMDNTESIAM